MPTTTVQEAFREQVEPLRPELTAHCYRMVGSVHEAEDLVQETYLRAWRGFHGFENRSSVRTWLYKIATNTCLTALRRKERRVLPTGLGQPSSDPVSELDWRPEVPWLEPLPDAVLWGEPADDPAATAVSRESVRIAFVAALQHLTAQQRAVVILCDVLAWRAREAAETLGLSAAAVNSTLQRSRGHLARLTPHDAHSEPDDERARELLQGYLAAFENYDVASIVRLLTEDAVWEMPPVADWYAGAAAIGELITTQCPAERAGDMRMLPTAGNGQSMLAMYMRDTDGVQRPFQLHQLTLTEAGVSHVVSYFDTTLFDTFGLPPELDW